MQKLATLFTWIQRWARIPRARWYYLWGILHRHYANVLGDSLEYEIAAENFTHAIALNPDFAQAYLDRGILYWREFDHPRRAIQDLTKALALKPTLYEALFNRGIAHQQLQEYALALKDFRIYLEKGSHPHWREYAEKMIRELNEWTPQEEVDEQGAL